jgi:membrane associated rhomboid family serine protease
VAKQEPIFNVPGVVLAVLALFLAVHGLRLVLSPEKSEWLILAMAFIPSRYAGFADEIPGGVIASVTSFVTHMLVHGDALHLGINSAWLLAFGSIIARRVGSIKFLALFIGSGIAGALTFLVLHPGLAVPVVGASGGISGLMGAVMRFLFPAINSGQGWMLREAPHLIPRMSLQDAFRDYRFLATSIFFVLLNLLAIWGIGSPGASGPIAWEAHLGGYFFGLFAFALFDVAAQPEQPSETKVE